MWAYHSGIYHLTVENSFCYPY